MSKRVARVCKWCGHKVTFDVEKHDKEIYSKAIDDFVKLVHKYDWNIRNINENSFIYGAIDTLAEQLKAGGENEQGI